MHAAKLGFVHWCWESVLGYSLLYLIQQALFPLNHLSSPSVIFFYEHNLFLLTKRKYSTLTGTSVSTISYAVVIVDAILNSDICGFLPSILLFCLLAVHFSSHLLLPSPSSSVLLTDWSYFQLHVGAACFKSIFTPYQGLSALMQSNPRRLSLRKLELRGFLFLT